MLVERTSILTGTKRIREVPISEAQYRAWKAGALLGYVAPALPLDESEFLITGITPDEWKQALASEQV